jgi:hypothetical protein
MYINYPPFIGLSWVTVEFPADRVYQLSVGVDALWLLTMEGKVHGQFYNFCCEFVNIDI